MKPKRVVLLSTPTVDQNLGGLAAAVYQMAYALAAEHETVYVLHPPTETPVEVQKVGDKAPIVITVPCDPRQSNQAAVVDALERWFASLEAGVQPIIHHAGIWIPFSRAILRWAHSRHIPIILAPHGMLEALALSQSRWKKKAAWWLYQRRQLRRVTAFHACSDQEAASIRRLGFHQPIQIVPNGVYPPDSLENPRPETPAGTKRTALYLGRLHPTKGLPDLIAAWAKVKATGWQLKIVGNAENSYDHVLRQKIKQAASDDSISLSGPLYGANKAAAFRSADLFILPSHTENFGLVVAEALSYGVPVICTEAAPWRALENEKCGWWVPIGEPSLTKALQVALSTPHSELRAMGARGQRYACATYSWPAIAQRMGAAYRKLADDDTA